MFAPTRRCRLVAAGERSNAQLKPPASRIRDSRHGGLGATGRHSGGRRGGARRLGMIFYDELHCFRRFLKVVETSATVYARAEAAFSCQRRQGEPTHRAEPLHPRIPGRSPRWAGGRPGTLQRPPRRRGTARKGVSLCIGWFLKVLKRFLTLRRRSRRARANSLLRSTIFFMKPSVSCLPPAPAHTTVSASRLARDSAF